MPKQVTLKIISIQRRFLWASNSDKRPIPLVKWELVQRPKYLGGLGVEDVTIKNAALLFKWWWRFFTEDKPLWKNIICSIHNIKHSAPPQDLRARNNGIWGEIINASKMQDVFGIIVARGFKRKVGNGNSTKFWLDTWIGDTPLKVRYPRLFRLSIQQDCNISDMRLWDGLTWKWNFLWRRSLFCWELPITSRLLEEVSSTNLHLNEPDSICWTLDNSENYTSKSFTRSVWDEKSRNLQTDKTLTLCWTNFAPLRVELLVWLVLQKKLNTRDRLNKLNMIPSADLNCILCNHDIETVDHIFTTCDYAYALWTSAKAWWNLTIPIPNKIEVLFRMWMAGSKKSMLSKARKALFFAIIDQIWTCRNSVFYENSRIDAKRDSYLIKLRLAHWLKAWNEDLKLSPAEIVNKFADFRAWGKY